jgi:hypothetical protein
VLLLLLLLAPRYLLAWKHQQQPLPCPQPPLPLLLMPDPAARWASMAVQLLLPELLHASKLGVCLPALAGH